MDQVQQRFMTTNERCLLGSQRNLSTIRSRAVWRQRKFRWFFISNWKRKLSKGASNLKGFTIPGSNGVAQDYIENAVVSSRWEVNNLLRRVSSGTHWFFSQIKITDSDTNMR